jgi:hypothetical protein
MSLHSAHAFDNSFLYYVSIFVSVITGAFGDALTSTTYESGIKLLGKLKASQNFNQLGEVLAYA